MHYTFSEAQLKQFVALTTQIVLENSYMNETCTRVSSHITFDEALHLEGAMGIKGLSHIMPVEMEVLNDQQEFVLREE